MSEKPSGVIAINPPPEDSRCQVCGRPAAALKPFGGPGDPLEGDFTGAMLVKTFRSMAPEGSAEKYLTPDVIGVDGFVDEEKFIQKHGLLALERFRDMGECEASKCVTPDVLKAGGQVDGQKYARKHGEAALQNFYLAAQLEFTVEASWECRDCILLSDDERIRKRAERTAREEKDAIIQDVISTGAEVRLLNVSASGEKK